MIPTGPRTAVALLVGAALVAAACGTAAGVESEQAWSIGPATTLPDSPPGERSQPDDPAAPAATTTTTVTPDDVVPDEVDDDVLVFDLARFDIEMRRRSTIAVDASDIAARGFRAAALLGDGSIVAAGYELPAGPGGATFGALWHSVDGFEWTRVASEVGDGPGQQLVPVLLADDAGRAVAAAVSVESFGTPSAVTDGLAYGWTSSNGRDWASGAPIGDASINTGTLFDDRVFVAGAADPNTTGFAATVYVEPVGAGLWTKTVVDTDEAPSLINDLVVLGANILAVGGTASSDPAAADGTTLSAMQLTTGPVDIALWRSADGEDWDPVATGTFAATPGPASAESAVVIDDRLFLLASTTVSDRTALELYRSDDLGDTWVTIPLPSPVGRGDAQLGPVEMWVVDGAVIIAEGRLGVDEQRLFVTVIDPVNDEAVSHDVSAELGVSELADVIDFDDAEAGELGLGVGRSTVSDDPAGLQTVEIRRIDDPDSGGVTASDA